MPRSCCFAVVLAVVCLPVILLSLEADVQPAVDETTSCHSVTLEDVMNAVEKIATNQHENAAKMREIKNDIDLLRNEMQEMKVLFGLKYTNLTELICESRFIFHSRSDRFNTKQKSWINYF